MSNAFVIIKVCYVHNQWYDISCATLYIVHLKVCLLCVVDTPFSCTVLHVKHDSVCMFMVMCFGRVVGVPRHSVLEMICFCCEV